MYISSELVFCLYKLFSKMTEQGYRMAHCMIFQGWLGCINVFFFKVKNQCFFFLTSRFYNTCDRVFFKKKIKKAL